MQPPGAVARLGDGVLPLQLMFQLTWRSGAGAAGRRPDIIQ